MKLNMCIVQFDRSATQPDLNRKKMINLLKSISTSVNVILLPEDWIGPLVVDHEYYESIIDDFQNLLTNDNTILVTGAQYVHYPEKTISTGAFVTHNDIILYDKHFPSQAIGERSFITPGTNLPLKTHLDIKMASLVCVDLFYPELARYLAVKGAQIIFNPASVPAHRMNLWQHIGITRAAENTVFIAMANNTMTCYPDGRKVMGRSFVAGPDGVFFKDFGNKPGVNYIELDLGLISQVRERWQYLNDINKFEPNFFSKY